jgi:hypothetical protein
MIRQMCTFKPHPDKEHTLVITTSCPFCFSTTTFDIPEADWYDGIMKWNTGALIQSAFPKLNADQRELLKTGICTPCFNNI